MKQAHNYLLAEGELQAGMLTDMGNAPEEYTQAALSVFQDNFLPTITTPPPVPFGVALINDKTGSVLQTTSNADGQYQAFLAPSTPYTVLGYDPSSGLSAIADFTTSASGSSTQIPQLLFGSIEGVTLTTTEVNALANLEAAPNPLTSQGLPTAIIAQLPLQGEAEAVTLTGSLETDEAQTAYVATGSYGLAIVDASQFQNPVVLGQLQLPGNSVDVSVDSSLQIAAVASGSSLNLINVSNPTQPTLIQSLDIAAEAVKVFEGVAYVAEGNEVVAVDLVTGGILASESFSGGEVDDLGIDQVNLYVLASEGYQSHTIYKLVLNGSTLETPTESLTITGHPTFGRMRLFAANGYVYVGASDENDVQEVPGVEVLQDTGSSLTLVGPSSAITAFDVTTNGSGLALYTGANADLSDPQVGLLDLSDPTNTDDVLTVFNTPGVANSVAMADGIGFVADGSAGLAVLNYLPFDNKGIPPTASISLPSSVILGTDGSNLEVSEGSTIPVLADVADDVQVRNVELLVNGQVVENAVSAPFNLSVTLPTIAQNGSTPVTIQVEAFDTGGNVGTSNVLSVELVRDTTPPQLVYSNIPDGTIVGVSFQTVILQFSKPLDESTVTPSNFQVIAPNSTVLTPESIQFRDDDRTVQLTLPMLQLGTYQFAIDAAAITDRSGNPLGSSNLTSSFTVLQYSAVWINPNGGDWSTPSNWESGVVPGPGDSVLIDVTNIEGDRPTITFDSGFTEITSLLSYDPLTLAGGILQVDATMEVDNTFTLAGGTLRDAQVVKGSGSEAIVADSFTNSILDNVYLNVDIDLSQSSLAFVTLENGLTLNGTATIGSGNFLEFEGVLTAEGPGTVVLDGGSMSIDSPGTLTIASGLTIQGAGDITGDGLINEGTISVDGTYNSLDLQLKSFENQGSLGVSNGASLSVAGLVNGLGAVSLTDSGSSLSIDGTDYSVDSSLDVTDGQTLDLLGTWTSEGSVTVTVSNATLGLGSTFGVNALSVSNSTIEVLGTSTFSQFVPLLTGTNLLAIGSGGILVNTGDTIGLDATTGNLILAGGTLLGGTVNASNGTEVVADESTTSTLDGVTLNSNLDLTAGLATVSVTGGMILNGTISVGFFANLSFIGQETLSGTGTVDLEYGSEIEIDSSGTLTIASGIQLLATDSSIMGGSLISEGTIEATGTGLYLQVQVSSFVNGGSISVSDGAVLFIAELNTGLGNVSIIGSDSRLYVDGTDYVVDSSLTITNGQTLALLGTWTLGVGDTVTVNGGTLGLGSTFSLVGFNVTNSIVEVLGTSTFAQFLPLFGNGNSLVVGTDGVLNNTGGTIALTASTGNLTLAGGTLEGGTVTSSGGVEVVVQDFDSFEGIFFGNQFSTLDGVTLDSDIDIAADYVVLGITDGLILNGTASFRSSSGVVNGGSLRFSGDQTLNGTGDVLLIGDGGIEVEDDSTLTIGPNITIHGNSGGITPLFQASVVNQGTIEADAVGDGISIPYGTIENDGTIGASDGGSLTVNGLTGSVGNVVLTGTGSSVSFDGTNYTVDSPLTATDGQSLSLLGTWTAGAGATVTVTGAAFGLGDTTSLGAIDLSNSILNIQGTYTYSQLQPLLAGNNQLVIGQAGVLNNTGDTITLDASTGNLSLAGGTLAGGTVDASGGAKVVASAGFYSTLDGVTLNSDLDITADDVQLTVMDGLTLNGTATIGAASDQTGASIFFQGSETLDGDGDVLFGGGTGDNSIGSNEGSTLTIGPNMTVHGGSGTIGSSFGDTLINQGTIDADVSGDTISVFSATFQNEGSIGAANGGVLTISDLTGSLGNVSLTGADSSLTVNGTNYAIDSSISIASGVTLALLDSWTMGTGVSLTATQATVELGSLGDSSQVWDAGGAVSVMDGTLILGGSAATLAGIVLTNSTLDVQADYTYAQLQPILTGGNQLDIGPYGVLDNTGTTIALDATTGDLILSGGTLLGGTVTATGGASVQVSSSTYGSMLSAVTLDAGLTVQDEAYLDIQDGLTLNGDLTVSATPDFAAVIFDGTQTLDGTGQITFDGADASAYLILSSGGSGSTLTVGSGITINGGPAGVISTYDPNNNLIIQGTITADVDGDFIVYVPIQNDGTIEVANGGILTVSGLVDNAGALSVGVGSQDQFSGGFLQETTGTVAFEVGGTASGEYGSLTVSGGATFAGTLDVTLVDGYSPQVNDSVPVMTFDFSADQFDTVNVSNLPLAIAANLLYDPNDLTVLFGAAQMAADVASGVSADQSDLTLQQLSPVISQAIDLWAAAGVSPSELSRLRQVQFQVVNLPDAELGMEDGVTVWIDENAAGNGWYVNPAPEDSQSFGGNGPGGESIAAATSPASERMDLLTVVAHELGHLLGLGDDAGDDLMGEYLPAGTRRLPAAPFSNSSAMVAALSTTTAQGGTTSAAPMTATVDHVLQLGWGTDNVRPQTTSEGIAESLLQAVSVNPSPIQPTVIGVAPTNVPQGPVRDLDRRGPLRSVRSRAGASSPSSRMQVAVRARRTINQDIDTPTADLRDSS